MRKKYFSKEVEKCSAKNFAPCHLDKEGLAAELETKGQEALALAEALLGEGFPKYFTLPKILLLPVRKQQSFGKYALNAILAEEEKLQRAPAEKREELLAKLAKMKANVKIERAVRGSFFTEGPLVLYYCNICELCAGQGLDLKEYAASVLAHELFHALHFASCETTKNWKQLSYWNGVGYEYAKVSVVRESLAECFRYLWLRQCGQDALLASMLAELADTYATVPNFPYAGVKLLLKDEAVAAENFKEIYRLSLEDWKAAYEKLISLG